MAKKKNKRRLQVETLEPRILMSATWVEGGAAVEAAHHAAAAHAAHANAEAHHESAADPGGHGGADHLADAAHHEPLFGGKEGDHFFGAKAEGKGADASPKDASHDKAAADAHRGEESHEHDARDAHKDGAYHGDAKAEAQPSLKASAPQPADGGARELRDRAEHSGESARHDASGALHSLPAMGHAGKGGDAHDTHTVPFARHDDGHRGAADARHETTDRSHQAMGNVEHPAKGFDSQPHQAGSKAEIARESDHHGHRAESGAAADDHHPLAAGASHAGREDDAHTISLDLGAAFPKLEKSDVTHAEIYGVPDGAKLSAGSLQDDGAWHLEPKDLSHVRLIAPSDAHGELDLKIVASTVNDGEGAASGVLHVQLDGAPSASDLGHQKVSLERDGNQHQQAGLGMLAQANSAPQQVLKLLDGSDDAAGLAVAQSVASSVASSLGAQQKLSTGLKISRAQDDAAGLSVSNSDAASLANGGDGHRLGESFRHGDARHESGYAGREMRSQDLELQQAGVTVLAQANSAPQQVLKLLDGSDDAAGLAVAQSVVSSAASSLGAQQKLSTGLKISQAQDDAAGLSVATQANTASLAKAGDGHRVAEPSRHDDGRHEPGHAGQELLSQDGRRFENHAVPLDLHGALGKIDLREHASVQIFGLPARAQLSAGAQHADGSWHLASKDLAHLSVRLPPGVPGELDLKIVASNAEHERGGVTTGVVHLRLDDHASGNDLAQQKLSTLRDGNTLQQAGVNVLAQANSAPQQVLKLLDGSDDAAGLSIANAAAAAAGRAGSVSGHRPGHTDAGPGRHDAPAERHDPRLSMDHRNAHARDERFDGDHAHESGRLVQAGVGVLAHANHAYQAVPRFFRGGEETAGHSIGKAGHDAFGKGVDGKHSVIRDADHAADTPDLTLSDAKGLEDKAIPLDVQAALKVTDGSESLGVQVFGVPAGATLSAGSLQKDGSWTLAQDELKGLTITPPPNSGDDFDLKIVATSHNVKDGSVATSSAALHVHVDAVADAPVLALSDAQGSEGQPIPLDLKAGLTDTDGSESLQVQVYGVPAGAKLSAGTLQQDGSWTLSPEQLSGLTVTPAPHSDAAFDLKIVATSKEAVNGATATTSGTVHVQVNAVADAPALTVKGVTGNEDTAIPLSITSALKDTDGSETLSVRITGVPAGAMLSAGAVQPDGSYLLTPPQLSGLTITPPHDSAAAFDLKVTAISREAANGATASTAAATLHVTVTPVADAPMLTVHAATGNEDTAIPLQISSALTDTDGSEVLEVQIYGVPNGAILSHGTLASDGSWVLAAHELPNLTLTPVADGDANFTLRVVATSTEGANISQASTSALLHVTVNAVPDAPALTLANASGNEDTPIPLAIGATLRDRDGSESLEVRITGVPDGAALSAGSKLQDGTCSWRRVNSLDSRSRRPTTRT